MCAFGIGISVILNWEAPSSIRSSFGPLLRTATELLPRPADWATRHPHIHENVYSAKGLGA
jgi:hypothetical protein